VETSAGVILPDEYLKAIADAAHDVGALFVLDCIASGCVWVDMQATGVDVLISAPQKGWSASPAAGLVMLGARALERLGETTSSSFAVDLRKWHDIMQAYVSGGHAYHSTMPTDALVVLRDRMIETRDFGFKPLANGNGNSAARSVPCLRRMASSRSPLPASRRRASSSATRRTPSSRTAGSSWPKACRLPPACR
jgi:aspartate aminotransferase-like enzyme